MGSPDKDKEAAMREAMILKYILIVCTAAVIYAMLVKPERFFVNCFTSKQTVKDR